MAIKVKTNSIINIIGNPATVDRELKEFGKSARILSSRRKHLIAKYPEEWVAIYQGQVKAHGASQGLVLKSIDSIGVPRKQVILRFITKKPRAMIL